MYLWNTNALVVDLKVGRVTQREKAKYLIVFILLGSCAFDASWWCTEGFDTVDITSDVIRRAAFWVLNLAIVIGGVVLCYQANRRGDDIQFLDRFVCINCPVIIRLITLVTFAFGSYFAAGFYFKWINFESFPSDPNFEYAGYVISIVFQIIYYWRVQHHLIRISSSAPIAPNVA